MSSSAHLPGSHYQRPAEAILAVLDAPPPPSVVISPTHDCLLLVQTERYPPIVSVAAPMRRIAGLRIDPATNGPHLPPRVVGLTLVTISDGAHRAIALPKSACFSQPLFAADGLHFACSHTAAGGVELWIGDVKTATVAQVAGVRINAVYGPTVQWLTDHRTLACQTVPSGRGEPPAVPIVPAGPIVQESRGDVAPVRTYTDLLQNPHDEALFDYFATAQLVAVDSVTGATTPIGEPKIFAAIDPSPDGRFLLVAHIRKPYSYLHPASSFPHDIEVWDLAGTRIAAIAQLPLQDRVPIEGVPTGPRSVQWALGTPNRLVWAEALDGGDPKAVVPHRDRLMQLPEPFDTPPSEWTRIEHRFAGLNFDETGTRAMLRDYDRDRRWSRTFWVDLNTTDHLRLIWERSIHDRYNDPGVALGKTAPSGKRALIVHDDALFLIGAGASPTGDRPFLDRFQLGPGRTNRIFQCSEGLYETPIALLDDRGSAFLTRQESVASPPNILVRSVDSDKPRALTRFTDPTPQLRNITKRLVTYTRADGVPLSFTLYLPPDYEPGNALPTVLWAYPQEFNTPDTAGQVSGSPHRFTTLAGPTHLFFLLAGYAVLDGATMPVVGDPATANDTFIEQTVASAAAAIDQAVALGVTDRDRVGVGGHSYGAFMAANLLAHSDLFKAGIARSGAFNRTLTPFGFQNERRTFWEATDVYARMSPFQHAHRVKTPLLLIHGAADNNPGTFPLQSERMFQAVRGTGGIVRYVVLPHESHAYVARESVEHTLYEMISWFDKYVKVTGPISPTDTPP